MSEMQLRRVEVESSSGPHEADLFVCPCGGETWIMFRVAGQDHAHLQCADCGQSYCPAGSECGEPEARMN